MDSDKLINNQELKELVAQRGDFYLYEAQDFIEAFSYVVIKAMQEGKTIKIKDLFTLEPTRRKAMRVVNLQGQETMSQSKVGVKLKLSPYLKKSLNP